jgi:hypothetical protein
MSDELILKKNITNLANIKRVQIPGFDPQSPRERQFTFQEDKKYYHLEVNQQDGYVPTDFTYDVSDESGKSHTIHLVKADLVTIFKQTNAAGNGENTVAARDIKEDQQKAILDTNRDGNIEVSEYDKDDDGYIDAAVTFNHLTDASKSKYRSTAQVEAFNSESKKVPNGNPPVTQPAPIDVVTHRLLAYNYLSNANATDNNFIHIRAPQKPAATEAEDKSLVYLRVFEGTKNEKNEAVEPSAGVANLNKTLMKMKMKDGVLKTIAELEQAANTNQANSSGTVSQTTTTTAEAPKTVDAALKNGIPGTNVAWDDLTDEAKKATLDDGTTLKYLQSQDTKPKVGMRKDASGAEMMTYVNINDIKAEKAPTYLRMYKAVQFVISDTNGTYESLLEMDPYTRGADKKPAEVIPDLKTKIKKDKLAEYEEKLNQKEEIKIKYEDLNPDAQVLFLGNIFESVASALYSVNELWQSDESNKGKQGVSTSTDFNKIPSDSTSDSYMGKMLLDAIDKQRDSQYE